MPLTTQQKLEKKVLNDVSQERDPRVKLWDLIQAFAAAAIGEGYSKPSSGIPKTDMATAVQTSLGLADTSYQPGDTIALEDLGADIESAVNLAGQVIQTLGGLFLKFSDNADGSSAATVTAAAQGAKTKVLNVTLLDGNDVLQTWFTGPVEISTEVTCNDPDIGNLSQSPAPFVLTIGVAALTVTYATDAGATRTYIATDLIHVWVEEAALTIFGEEVDVTDADFLDTLVA